MDLEQFIDESINVSRAKKYNPTIFLRMRRDHGTVEAIRRLVENGEIQSGFLRMKELDLLDWSLEAAVRKFPREFSPSTLECAEFRLRMAQQGRRI